MKKIPLAAAPAKKSRVSPVAKPVAAQKPAKKPAASIPKKAAPPAQPPKKPAAATLEKVKLVRDSFTLPEVDHELIKRCKKAAVASGRETKKSEVVRAAIQTFNALPLEQQLKAYQALSLIAVGRPKSK